MKPILSKAQVVYMKAKKKFDDRAKVLEQQIAETRKTTEITEEVMEGLVLETGFHDAYSELTNAENELIEWSHTAIKNDKTYKTNQQPIDQMYSNLENNPEMRARIIQLAMKIR
ncbi:hypothetical protein PASE110613_08180 [Paenibacillus sediminis]|uniref:NurA-like 5'-3' nuclease n=1 Tax=Paenibacillus sediminis TaxID=664909 RepID=A0ABS4H2D5_9BACL|nr:hypothetical protein [Paenibacillus sediminis]MBP1936679.1 NurA-like 5'-3' nuclease [Paenibacillus sediminis]